MSPNQPRISIVIPVYNEEGILHAAVVDLRERLSPLSWSYEVILAENGSRDRTVAIAQELSAKYPEVRVLSIGEPNYGKAMKTGILESRGEYVICEEIDLCDTDFHQRAIRLLEAGGVDMVIGSKLIAGAEDDRPWARHAAKLAAVRLDAVSDAGAGDFDVAVIGGGVNGTGVLRDAAQRGLRVVLFEKNDIAFGASGNSSGMIHGGPRYLTDDPEVTRTSCLDSGHIQRIAPHLLFRVPFLMPIGPDGAEQTRIDLVDAFFEAYDRYQPLK